MDILDIDLDCVPMSESLEDFQNEYYCMEIIGEGGFGKVRKAVGCFDKSQVAIKFIANSKVTNWYYYSKKHINIPMEVALMCRCQGVSGVIKIYKYFHIQEHKGWYIVMERFENYIDLFDHITNMGQINEKEASNIMSQLIKILIRCHKLGVCHRDIKDENIIIDLSTNKIYLIDFGAGGFLRDGFYSEFDGTRVYSPPEWIQHKRYHAISLEIWSLGILLYDIVCGNLPYENDDGIVNCCLTFRRPISHTCQDLIISCLNKNPEKRPTLTEILNHRWFNCYSKWNNSVLSKSEPQIEFFQHSNKSNNTQSKIKLPDLSFPNEMTSRRASGETSPFITPQSSGIEDINYDNKSYPCHNSNPKYHVIQQKKAIKNNSPHSFNTFDFMK